MVFINDSVRRQDRLLDEDRAIKLLADGEFGFLAFGSGATAELSGGYGIPMSYAFDGESVWFHCALEGEKLRRIANNDRASFCVVGYTNVQPGQFTTLYESVIALGKIEIIEDEQTKYDALALLVRKYSPQFIEKGAKYAEKSIQRTAILRLRAERISGKAKTL